MNPFSEIVHSSAISLPLPSAYQTEAVGQGADDVLLVSHHEDQYATRCATTGSTGNCNDMNA